MMFEDLKRQPEHPIARVYSALARDSNPDKIDLGIGVYRDASGKSPIMDCVLQAESRLAAKQTTKEYLTPAGNRAYCREIEKLILGTDHVALREHRVCTIQTPGAGGGLRVGADLVRSLRPNAVMWIPAPTWEHQIFVFKSADLRLSEYPYYDRISNRLLFDEMMVQLRQATPGDVVLLHGCCHNPSGEDLSPDQWRELSALLVKGGLVPFVDLAYQGFGDGIEADVFGTQLLAAGVPEMILVSSSSKSFGIYRDRAGAISLVLPRPGGAVVSAEGLMFDIARSLYFMPPDKGAAIVAEVLADDALAGQWRRELNAMRERIVSLRGALNAQLAQRLATEDFRFIARQKGMFSLLPLSPDHLRDLERRHSLYLMPDGRMNFAALAPESVERVASALADTLSRGKTSPRQTNFAGISRS